MSISPGEVLMWLDHYKYLAIFPLAFIEGPIITILSGFLASLGELNFILAYLLIVAGDMTGDTFFYLMGRYSQRLPKKLISFFGLTKGRIIFIENQFKTNPKKLFSLGKASALGTIILFASGLSRFPYKKFFFYNLVLTIFKSLLLLIVGYYFGRAYASLKTYLDYGALGLAVLFIVFYVIFLKYSKSFSQYENNNRER